MIFSIFKRGFQSQIDDLWMSSPCGISRGDLWWPKYKWTGAVKHHAGHHPSWRTPTIQSLLCEVVAQRLSSYLIYNSWLLLGGSSFSDPVRRL
jgi:hypothetical protein